MRKVLHIISNCADLKRWPVPKELHLREVSAGKLTKRLEQWWGRIQGHSGGRIKAKDLYAGDHWAVVKSLPDVAEASGFRAHLWVSSAGYGLIPVDALIHPYSATFSGGHPDSVTHHFEGSKTRTELVQEWWMNLARFRDPKENLPRSLKELALDDPHAHILVVASPNYLSAMEKDLLETVHALHHADRLLIVSSQCKQSRGPLGDHFIASDARLCTRLGGACVSLNARVARKMLEEVEEKEFSVPIVRRIYQRLLLQTPPLRRIKRQPMTDHEVKTFIRTVLKSEPSSAYTPLLRSIRQSGRACEYGRFKTLFAELRRGAHAC